MKKDKFDFGEFGKKYSFELKLFSILIIISLSLIGVTYYRHLIGSKMVKHSGVLLECDIPIEGTYVSSVFCSYSNNGNVYDLEYPIINYETEDVKKINYDIKLLIDDIETSVKVVSSDANNNIYDAKRYKYFERSYKDNLSIILMEETTDINDKILITRVDSYNLDVNTGVLKEINRNKKVLHQIINTIKNYYFDNYRYGFGLYEGEIRIERIDNYLNSMTLSNLDKYFIDSDGSVVYIVDIMNYYTSDLEPHLFYMNSDNTVNRIEKLELSYE